MVLPHHDGMRGNSGRLHGWLSAHAQNFSPELLRNYFQLSEIPQNRPVS